MGCMIYYKFYLSAGMRRTLSIGQEVEVSTALDQTNLDCARPDTLRGQWRGQKNETTLISARAQSRG